MTTAFAKSTRTSATLLTNMATASAIRWVRVRAYTPAGANDLRRRANHHAAAFPADQTGNASLARIVSSTISVGTAMFVARARIQAKSIADDLPDWTEERAGSIRA